MKETEFETHVEYELEDPGAVNAFTAGMRNGNRNEWRRHPETAEMLDKINQNTKHTRIFVKTGEVSQRVK